MGRPENEPDIGNVGISCIEGTKNMIPLSVKEFKELPMVLMEMNRVYLHPIGYHMEVMETGDIMFYDNRKKIIIYNPVDYEVQLALKTAADWVDKQLAFSEDTYSGDIFQEPLSDIELEKLKNSRYNRTKDSIVEEVKNYQELKQLLKSDDIKLPLENLSGVEYIINDFYEKLKNKNLNFSMNISANQQGYFGYYQFIINNNIKVLIKNGVVGVYFANAPLIWDLENAWSVTENNVIDSVLEKVIELEQRKGK